MFTSTYCAIVLGWMPQNTFDDKPTLVHVVTWCRRTASHYHSQCWLRYALAANVMESLLINGICVNLIGSYCFWSYVQLRNEILLISSIHYVTKLNGQTQSVLSGDRWDSRERKKVISGVFTWSEVYLAITTLMLLGCVGFRQRLLIFLWTFKGDHATKFARTNTAANCQVVSRRQFSARRSQDAGVSQGCISKILRCNRDTGRPHQRKRGGSIKISRPREDRQLLRMVRTNRFISAPRLRMQMIRRFGRRMSVRIIRRWLMAAGYWSRRPARCPRLTLEHRRCRREWGRGHSVGTQTMEILYIQWWVPVLPIPQWRSGPGAP